MLNVWNVFCVNWNTVAGNNGSSVWCNGKKLCNFTSRHSSCAPKTTILDLNPSGVGGANGGSDFNGYLGFFSLFIKRSMPDIEIKIINKTLCNWFSVDYDPIDLLD